MDMLSDKGREIARAAAERHGVSAAAAEELLRALASGGGGQAQFSHPDLGGMGQWSRGGMLMIGDMFNNALKARVDALATDLSNEVARADVLRRDPGAGGSGWPAEFGSPASSGAQNDMRYAFFPAQRRLVISRGGVTEIYDSGDHAISGVGQAQGGGQTISFSTTNGPLRLSDLRRLDAGAGPAEPSGTAPALVPRAAVPVSPTPVSPTPVSPMPVSAEPATPATSTPAPALDILGTIERLADLRGRGVLTDEEFAAKKAELLSRL